MDELVIAGRTAMSRTTPSLPVKMAVDNGFFGPGDWVFDWGCGRGADMLFLNNLGCYANGYDPVHMKSIRPLAHVNEYMYCMSIYVLNVISDQFERDYLLQDMRNFVCPGGMVYIATRSEKEVNAEAVKNGWQPDGDGWRTGTGTFQKGYTPDTLARLLIGNGYGDVLQVSANPCVLMAHTSSAVTSNPFHQPRLITENIHLYLP